MNVYSFVTLPVFATCISLEAGVSEVVNAAQKKWELTREGFDKFLVVLDSDREQAGRRYELLRTKLISFFDWRNSIAPEDHADEALNRVIRKLEAGEEIREPATYVFGIARMMLFEIARADEKQRLTLNQTPVTQSVDEQTDESERRIEGLKRCLAALPERDRDLITKYYENEGPSSKIVRRKELALSLGLQLNALRIRACRLREKLEHCLQRRLTDPRV